MGKPRVEGKGRIKSWSDLGRKKVVVVLFLQPAVEVEVHDTFLVPLLLCVSVMREYLTTLWQLLLPMQCSQLISYASKVLLGLT